jgi:hypothetical protein
MWRLVDWAALSLERKARSLDTGVFRVDRVRRRCDRVRRSRVPPRVAQGQSPHFENRPMSFKVPEYIWR